MLEYLPLVLVVVVLAAALAAPASDRVDTRLSRAAFRIFRGEGIDRDSERERLLRAAAIGTPYREYVVKTRLYLILGAAAGGVVGAYSGRAFAGFLRGAAGGESAGGRAAAALTFEGAGVAFPVAGAVLVAALGTGTAYAVRWRLPAVRADSRRREIEAGLPRTVAFTYALARGGMSFADVLRTISRNDDVFGESAAAVGVAVRDIDRFDVDLVTAIQRLSETTPSEGFGTFTENLSSVLRSGGDVSEFLRGQYERYRDEAEDRQAEMLNLLATTAEVYVTLIVAGMLFLVTILLIIGLTAGDTLTILRVLTYVVIPAANLLFLAYLLDVTRPLRVGGGSRTREGTPDGSTALPDGGDNGYTQPGSAANHGRFAAYRRLRSVRETLASPLASVLRRPTLLLYVTVPIAAVATVARLPEAVAGGGVDLRIVDDLLVQAVLFLTGTFALVYEYKKRRLQRLEGAVPDLLERLASLNEAGISVVSSFERVRRSDVGALDAEVDRIWRDMRWGATAGAALERFESRVRTPSITRVVTLLTNAMRASNDIGPVLRIAAEQARADLQLRRRRRQEMFTYLVVVYVSFLVFLIVIGALEYVLIPSLPDVGALSESAAGGAGLAAGFEAGDRDAYRLVFFHTALVQSALSGLVAGVMGGGSVADGMKHTAAMLSITYVALALLA